MGIRFRNALGPVLSRSHSVASFERWGAGIAKEQAVMIASEDIKGWSSGFQVFRKYRH